MKNRQNRKIRFHILGIAVIGAGCFLAYLVASLFLAHQNETRLQDLLNRQQPVIEQLREIKARIQSVRELLVSAVGLEEAFIVWDSEDESSRVRQSLAELMLMAPEMESYSSLLQSSYERYYSHAFEMANLLIDDPGSLQLTKLTENNELYSAMLQLLDAQIDAKQTQFTTLLQQINREVAWANTLGGLLGGVIIVVLFVLAWVVSNRVLRLINHSNRMKDEFLATISHEMRTPMNGITGALNLLSNSKLDPVQNQWLDAATLSAEDMMRSIDDLLSLSEILSGELRVHLSAVDLEQELARVMAGLTQATHASGQCFKLNYQLPKGKKIETDQKKICLMLHHILDNAVKFSQGDTIEVAVTMTQDSRLQVSVLDSGPGISEPGLEQLLDPFQQFDGSFSRRYQGMGVGLTICHGFARILSGELILKNRPQGGLLVQFSLPLCWAQGVDDAGDKQRQSHGSNGQHPSPGLRVLVVEDNPVNQMVLKGFLSKLGCSVDTADDGEEALDKVALGFDLVFMDCQMPVLDGFEATRRIRAMAGPESKVPIVAVTANAMGVDRQSCIQAGMDGYIEKPVKLSMLASELERYASRAA